MPVNGAETFITKLFCVLLATDWNVVLPHVAHVSSMVVVATDADPCLLAAYRICKFCQPPSLNTTHGDVTVSC